MRKPPADSSPLPPLKFPKTLWFCMLALLVLIIWPKTSQTMRRELTLQFTRDRESHQALQDLGFRSEESAEPKPIEQTVTIPSGDAAMAAVQVMRDRVSPSVGSATPQQLRGLYRVFPKSVELRAMVLRMGCMQDITIQRPDLAEYTGESSTAATVNPDTLEPYLRDAEVGESLDPDNGYFPTMAAIILLGQRHDQQALDALHRAAIAKRWDDYSSWEALGQLRYEKLRSHNDAVRLLAVSASILFPHYAKIRSLARNVLYFAHKHERDGNLDAGLAIRRDVALIGSKMRVDSHNAIGSMVGSAVSAIAPSRFGGAPAVKNTRQRFQWTTGYPAYLKRIGHPKDAEWFIEEMNLSALTRSQMNASFGSNPLWGQDLFTMVKWSCAAMLAATLVIWYGFLSAFGYLYERRRRNRDTQNRFTEDPFVAIVMVAAVMVSLGYLGYNQWDRIYAESQIVVSIFSLSAGSPPAWLTNVPEWALPAAVVTVVAAPLIMLLTVSSIIAIIKHRPILRLWARAAFKVGTVVVLLSTIALWIALPQYAAINDNVIKNIDQSQQNEMAYYAKISGKPFPGAPKTVLPALQNQPAPH